MSAGLIVCKEGQCVLTLSVCVVSNQVVAMSRPSLDPVLSNKSADASPDCGSPNFLSRADAQDATLRSPAIVSFVSAVACPVPQQRTAGGVSTSRVGVVRISHHRFSELLATRFLRRIPV